MGELINFPVKDKFYYVMDGDKVLGCCTDELSFSNEGSKVNIIVDQPIEKSEVKEKCGTYTKRLGRRKEHENS